MVVWVLGLGFCGPFCFLGGWGSLHKLRRITLGKKLQHLDNLYFMYIYCKYFAYKPPNKEVTNLQTVSFSCFRNSVRLLNVDSESNACGYSGAIHCVIIRKPLSDLPNIIVMAACKNWGMQTNMQLAVFPSHQNRNVACLLETRNHNSQSTLSLSKYAKVSTPILVLYTWSEIYILYWHKSHLIKMFSRIDQKKTKEGKVLNVLLAIKKRKICKCQPAPTTTTKAVVCNKRIWNVVTERSCLWLVFWNGE